MKHHSLSHNGLTSEVHSSSELSSVLTLVTMIQLPCSASCGSANWIVVTAVVLGILVALKLFASSLKHKNLPPGPRGLPIIGCLHLLGKHPHQDLAKLAEIYGPVMSMWMGSKLNVVASSPAAAKEILRTQGPNFSSRPAMSFSQAMVPGDIVTEDDSPRRLHLKKLFHKQLSSTKQLQQTANVRNEEIAHLLCVMPKDGATIVPVKKYIEATVTNIISRLVLKKRFIEVAKEEDEGLALEEVRSLKKITDAAVTCGLQFEPGDYISIFKWIDITGCLKKIPKLTQQMDEFMSKIIVEHLEQRNSNMVSEKDMADVLLDQMEDESLQFDITKQNIANVMWDSFIAGISTTTDTSEWALAECIHNPNVLKKAQAELDSVVGKSRGVEDADIPNLKYLQAIVKETFRLHPPSPLLVPHMSINACQVFGYDIPAGTTTFVNVGAIGKDPSIWEDPLAFKPERFLEEMPHANTNIHGQHFELLPFGSGRRACPGLALGSTMVYILLATFLQYFDWSLPNDLQAIDLDMSVSEGVLSPRAQPLIAIPKARLSTILS